MEEVYRFLKEAETYYLATVEGDQPRMIIQKFCTLRMPRRHFHHSQMSLRQLHFKML